MATNGTTTHSPLDCDTFNCKQCSEPITSQTGLESFDKQSLPPDHPLAVAQGSRDTAASAGSPPTRNFTITSQHSVPGTIRGWHVPDFLKDPDDPIRYSVLEAYRQTTDPPHTGHDHGHPGNNGHVSGGTGHREDQTRGRQGGSDHAGKAGHEAAASATTRK